MLMDILQLIGLGGQVMLAASVGFGAWYLIKFLRIGRAAGSVVAGAIRYTAAIAGFLAVGIALGWIDLAVGALFGDLQEGAGVVWQAATGWGMDLVQDLLE